MTINNTWAYNEHDRHFKTTRHLIRTLIDVASRGGNFLLNVGPRPDGAIQPEFQRRLRGLGDWMRVNGDSIYGTTFGPLQDLPGLRTTAKGKMVYLHLYEWPPASTLSVPGLPRVLRITMLADGRPVSFQQGAQSLSIELPAQAPDPNATVLALEMA